MKLGILIELADIRLTIGANDPYTWQIPAEKAYLFKKIYASIPLGLIENFVGELMWLKLFGPPSQATLRRANHSRREEELEYV